MTKSDGSPSDKQGSAIEAQPVPGAELCETTEKYADYWKRGARNEPDHSCALICMEQAVNGWKNLAYDLARRVHYAMRAGYIDDPRAPLSAGEASVALINPLTGRGVANGANACGPQSSEAPIDMLLFCPRCGLQHVDAPDPETGWTNPPHATHTCKGCGLNWRPSNALTNGAGSLPAEEPKHAERMKASDPLLYKPRSATQALTLTDEEMRQVASRRARHAVVPNTMTPTTHWEAQEVKRAEEVIYYALKEAFEVLGSNQRAAAAPRGEQP
jgi:hypothetical protein